MVITQTTALAGLATVSIGVTLLYQYRRLQDPTSQTKDEAYASLTDSVRKVRAGSRNIGFAQYGDSTSSERIAIFFHGLPGSRIVPVPQLKELCRRSRLRLIAIERPGIGLTSKTIDGQSSFGTSSQDVMDILQEVGHDGKRQKVSVIGYSLGGPLALHFVHSHPELVDRVYLIGTAGFDSPAETYKIPDEWTAAVNDHQVKDEAINIPNRAARFLARYAPSVLTALWTLMAPSLVRGDDYSNSVLEATNPEDRAKLTDADIHLWKLTTRETFRQGISGMLTAILEVFGTRAPNGWGWDVSKLCDQMAANGVQGHLYAANADTFVPLSLSLGIAELIGLHTEDLTVYAQDVGHLSLLRDAMVEIVTLEGKQAVQSSAE
ncbi:Hypothetical protein D9617_14g077200 [Elsinoe fawcettii]|nr:Hypothetical protein D9617_14g077200 [Elsinoe fawcettii]